MLSLKKALNLVANLSLGYQRGNLDIKTNSLLNVQESMLIYNQDLSVNYKNLGLSVNENIIHSYGPEGGTTNATDIGLSYNTGKFNNRAFAHFEAGCGTYGLASNYSLDKKITENLGYNLSPTLSAMYNTGAKSTTLTPEINAGVNYNKGDITIGASVVDSFSATMYGNNEPFLNNNLIVNGNIRYKGLEVGVSYNNMSNKFSAENTYKASIAYRIKESVALRVDASHQNGIDKMSNDKTKTNKITLSCLLKF